MHSSLNSHQSWEEAGQGLGNLLTVVTSSLHPALQTQFRGWEEESEKREIQGLRAMPPLIFIAGELEICLSLPILGRQTQRMRRGGTRWCRPNTPPMAMPGLPWANTGLPRGPGNSWVSVPLRLALTFKGNHNHPPWPPKTKSSGSGLGPLELRSGQCTKDQAEFSTGRKGEV